MATIDHPIRTQFYVQTASKGLRRLPYELVTVDGDVQGYELVSAELDENFEPRRAGTLTPPVILDSDRALPIGDAITPIFEYHGI